MRFKWLRRGALRQAGDEARDRKDWISAVREYRRHLRRHPRDFAIWVQLGHALKEAGGAHDALGAYAKAWALDPGDADLQLNLGHLHKLLGDRPAAIAHFALCFAQGRND